MRVVEAYDAKGYSKSDKTVLVRDFPIGFSFKFNVDEIKVIAYLF